MPCPHGESLRCPICDGGQKEQPQQDWPTYPADDGRPECPPHTFSKTTGKCGRCGAPVIFAEVSRWRREKFPHRLDVLACCPEHQNATKTYVPIEEPDEDLHGLSCRVCDLRYPGGRVHPNTPRAINVNHIESNIDFSEIERRTLRRLVYGESRIADTAWRRTVGHIKTGLIGKRLTMEQFNYLYDELRPYVDPGNDT